MSVGDAAAARWDSLKRPKPWAGLALALNDAKLKTVDRGQKWCEPNREKKGIGAICRFYPLSIAVNLSHQRCLP